MILRYLEQEEKGSSRELYEICFPEDTAKFTDYYYKEKCRDNEIIVLEETGRICSMIHANPYEFSFCKNPAQVHYLVAVATHPHNRRQGCMRQLLVHLLRDQWNREEPFSFLMPADPVYYEPFGYRFWSNQRVWKFGQEAQELLYRYCMDESNQNADADSEALAQTVNEILKEKFDLYIPRNASYYERMKKEQKSEEGSVVALFDSRKNPVGCFCYSMEDGFEVREPMLKEHAVMPEKFEKKLILTEEKESLMMGRIVHFPSFVKMLRFADVYEDTLQIRDELLPENNGCYRIYIDCTGGTAEKVEQCENARAMDIAIFGQQMFDRLKVFVNELV